MAPNRVVSLAPSATEILRALGAGDRLEGVTHHCSVDAPAVGGWLNPDFEAVEARGPDLVLTADPLQTDARDELRERGHRVVHVEPGTLDEVVESFGVLGRAVGKPRAGHDLAWRARNRIQRVRRLVAGRDRPVVYCEEWSNPPTAAGNWVPDVVEVAGGRYPFCAPGERSQEVERGAVEDAEPEHVFLHVCGRGERSDREAVLKRDWEVPALERDAVHVLDDSVLNQPSPRLMDGIETMAATLHPEAME
ncbi:helical backbone metal receptor [Haladaptatus halobius]|uniref:helical backbone metal receptor n=1 Tax=Haladaptatus halobius TaxID=2884875 RepID=UPI001D0A9D4D|nr:helical backbone metal receptor [Haladaptatus halobius]